MTPDEYDALARKTCACAKECDASCTSCPYDSRLSDKWDDMNICSEDEQEDKYEQGFNILMEYFDSLPDEEKPKIHERLKKLGL